MKKILAVLAAAALLLAAFSACAEGEFVYDTWDGNNSLKEYTGEGGDIVIPETVDGHTVTRVTGNIFSKVRDAVTGITFPETVKYIDIGVINNLANLEKAVLPEDLQVIGPNNFLGTPGVKEIVVPPTVCYVGSGCFSSDADISVTFTGPVPVMPQSFSLWGTEPDGSILYYRYDPTPLAGTFNELGYWDFKKHVFDGRTYYSYHAPDDHFADRAFMGYDPGMRVLLDDRYVPVDTIHALPSRDGYLKGGEPLDGHDFYFFSPTHWIASASYIEREVDGKKLAVGYLQEVKDGEVVFDWWSSDHKEMADWCSPIFDTSYDYVHFNSVQVLPDGNWLCSFRVLNSLLKIDHSTGDILWRINGEALPENQSFYGQRYAIFHDDNTLTLFDNGNGHNPQFTRVLCLNVNPETGEVSGGGDMLNPGGDYFSQACGAVQLFSGGHFTVGWGWSSEAGNNTRLITEHNADGREVFGLRRSASDSRPNSVNPSYRCVKYN